MTSPDTALMSFGPGVLRYAPLGTAEPTALVGAWPAGWVQLGYTTEGHQASYGLTIADVEVAELLDPVRRVTTKRDIRVAFGSAELTAEHVKLALNGGTTAGDVVTFTDGVTNSTTTFTSASAAFSATTDVGKVIAAAGITPGTTIASVTNATTVILSAAATATASGLSFTITGRNGSFYTPPQVGSEVRRMLGWDADDATERIVWRQVIQAGTAAVPRRKGADYAKLPMEFAVEVPGGGLQPFKWGFSTSRLVA